MHKEDHCVHEKHFVLAQNPRPFPVFFFVPYLRDFSSGLIHRKEKVCTSEFLGGFS